MNIEKMFERPDVEQLVHAFSLLENEDDIKTFLTDLCTPREVCDFAQRLQVARSLAMRCLLLPDGCVSRRCPVSF